jgi:hypothetical protein
VSKWRRRLVAIFALLPTLVVVASDLLHPLLVPRLERSIFEDVLAFGAAAGATAVVVSLPKLHDESEQPFLIALGGLLLLGAALFVGAATTPSWSWLILAGSVFVPATLYRLFVAPRKRPWVPVLRRASLDDYAVSWPPSREPGVDFVTRVWRRRGLF